MAELRVRRDDFAVCDLVAGEGPREDDLAEGEAQLRVDRFALTTNNVTYAVLGDQLGYWKPFPAPATKEPPAGSAGEGGVADVARPAKLRRRQSNPEDAPSPRPGASIGRGRLT